MSAAVRAEALVLTEPLNFWAGLDVPTGVIRDAAHPQHGERISDRALVMPPGEGSSSNTSVLVEAVRVGTAPAALVIEQPTAVTRIAAVVAEALYGRPLPVAVVDAATHAAIRTGDTIVIDEDGSLTHGGAAGSASSENGE